MYKDFFDDAPNTNFEKNVEENSFEEDEDTDDVKRLFGKSVNEVTNHWSKIQLGLDTSITNDMLITKS